MYGPQWFGSDFNRKFKWWCETHTRGVVYWYSRYTRLCFRSKVLKQMSASHEQKRESIRKEKNTNLG